MQTPEILPKIDEERTVETICSFIKNRMNESERKGLVIGLSGGLDSTTTAYLCVKAVGAENVLGLVLPSETTSKEDVQDALTAAEALGINYRTVDVDEFTKPFKNLSNSLEDTELADANLKARIRMTILYYHANAMKRLVVGTGNRTELLVGYFTKYGDGGVDMLPIGALYKTDVRKLASHLRVPSNIIEKAPTAGLWAGQTDEDELGIKYELLDKILHLMVDKKFEDQDVADALSVPVDEVLRIKNMVKSAEHKLKPLPIAGIG